MILKICEEVYIIMQLSIFILHVLANVVSLLGVLIQIIYKLCPKIH